MPGVYSARASFDNYLYWGVFLFIAVFLTYFLVSMIDLAEADTHIYDTTTLSEYEFQMKKNKNTPEVAPAEIRALPADAQY